MFVHSLLLKQLAQEVNVSDVSSLEAAPSARWDAIVLPPATANYTFLLRCHGKAKWAKQLLLLLLLQKFL